MIHIRGGALLFAYIDRGSSSFIIQLIADGAAALLRVARTWWRRSVDAIGRRGSADTPDQHQ